jgi:hypothetical protein
MIQADAGAILVVRSVTYKLPASYIQNKDFLPTHFLEDADAD